MTEKQRLLDERYMRMARIWGKIHIAKEDRWELY